MSHQPRKMTALTMRDIGMTYREIGERFGVSRSRAQQLVEAGKRIREWRLQSDAKLFAEECRNRDFKAYELQMLLPLLGFLKELADGPTTDSK